MYEYNDMSEYGYRMVHATRSCCKVTGVPLVGLSPGTGIQSRAEGSDLGPSPGRQAGDRLGLGTQSQPLSGDRVLSP